MEKKCSNLTIFVFCCFVDKINRYQKACKCNSGISSLSNYDKVDELRMYPPLPHILNHFSSLYFQAKVTKEIEALMLAIIYTSMCQQLATELPVKTWNVIFLKICCRKKSVYIYYFYKEPRSKDFLFSLHLRKWPVKIRK